MSRFIQNLPLKESVKPSSIDFGSNPDMNDGLVKSTSINGIQTHFTCFEWDGLYYAVGFQKVPNDFIQNDYGHDEYDLGFGVSTEPSNEYLSYSDDEVPAKRVVQLFGKIIFVASKIVEQKSSINLIAFTGHGKKFNIYQSMINNKPLKAIIENELGFTYDGIQGDSIIMIRG